MKKILLYTPIVLSLLLLGAHFLRYGNTLVVAGVVVVLALLFVRQSWAARVVQFVLALGAMEWLRTLVMLVQLRMAMGEPYLRMIAILGVVIAVTIGAALLFQAKELKATYRIDAAS